MGDALFRFCPYDRTGGTRQGRAACNPLTQGGVPRAMFECLCPRADGDLNAAGRFLVPSPREFGKEGPCALRAGSAENPRWRAAARGDGDAAECLVQLRPAPRR